MGKLLKALSAPSSASAKGAGLWDDIIDRIEGALLPCDLDEFERWLAANELQIPQRWWEPIQDRLAMKRDELASEDIGAILRQRFDF